MPIHAAKCPSTEKKGHTAKSAKSSALRPSTAVEAAPESLEPLAVPIARSFAEIPLFPVQRQRDGALPGETSDFLFSRVSARRGQGQGLPPESRDRMERGFGVDLQPVRIHTDVEAGSLARAAQARAFASGTDIYFAPGTFRPGSPAGDRLLAHEVAHVVQQATEAVPRGVHPPGDRYEVAANRAADTVLSGRSHESPASTRLSAGPRPIVQREIVFESKLMQGLSNGKSGYPDVFFEFLQGLQTYLALSYETKGGDDKQATVSKPEKSQSGEETIKAKFKANYQKRYNNSPAAPELAAKGLETWAKVRQQVFEALESGTIKVGTMPDDALPRLGRALGHSRRVELNVKDIQNMTASSKEVAKSFDGFWTIVHEILHITLAIKDDADSSKNPVGVIEPYLNPLRIGFGLPERTTYGGNEGGKSVIGFENGGKVTFADR